MKRLAVLLILGFVLSGTAVAQQKVYATGQDLHDYWLSYQRATKTSNGTSAADVQQGSVYVGYVEGSVETYIALFAYTKHYMFTIPPNVSMIEVLAVVGKYLDDHPEQWSYPASVIVAGALRNAYPTPTTK